MRVTRSAGGRAPFALASVAFLATLLACGDGAGHHSASHESLAFLHASAESASHSSPPPGATLIPPGLDEIESVPVRLEGHDFRVATRASGLLPGLLQAPCSECHGATGAAPAAAGTPRRAHWQIARAHGAAPLDCASCHLPRDPSQLAAPSAEPARPVEAWPLEHSYRMCGTCHFGELRDWAGGAHGKRLAGWSGPRVVAPCTACHDPHDPGIPKRLPATFSPPPGEGRR